MNAWAKLFSACAVLALGASLIANAAPARDEDPVLIGSVWKGKLTQRGGGPTGFDCELRITKRDGEKFDAELYEKSDEIELTYLVRGKIKIEMGKDKEKVCTIAFESYDAKDVKNTAEILNVPYTGTVSGKKIKGTWKLPPDSEFGKLEGDFEFELSKKKE
jgi:hypothetical protein